MTQINRTPFRKVADIPAHLLTSDKLKWEISAGNRDVAGFTSDGRHFGYLHDVGATNGFWQSVDKHEFRPHGLSWEAAEALVNPPQPEPQPAKTEEPFRPGLPPAELRAVCEEWEWRAGSHNEIRSTAFIGEKHLFLDVGVGGRRKEASELTSSIHFTVFPSDHFRPLGKTWAEVEALAAAKQYRTVGEVLKAGLFDVCSHWYVKGHSEERRLGIVQERIISSSTSVRVVKDLLTSSSGHFSADDLIRPSRVTWEALEAELAAKKSNAAPVRKLTPNETSTRKHPVPVGGWVMRTDEGYPGVPTGTKAQVESVNGSGSCYKVRVPSGAIHAWSPEFCEPCEPPVEMVTVEDAVAVVKEGCRQALPQDGDPITVANALSVIKEGCKQAIAEDRQEAIQRNAARQQASTSSASGTTFIPPLSPVEIKYSAAPTRRTYIIAVPKGRRKYVKYYLSQHIYMGNIKNLDALPYSTADKPFYVGYVSAKLREELTALAPDIRFSVG